ncbi:hypothetical protein [Clostridium sp. L74]|nr:hypothetical protein [Clostridium sp. L74]KOR25714.1 hypothetical protein ND00_13500 [Clostridium sp. L74]
MAIKTDKSMLVEFYKRLYEEYKEDVGIKYFNILICIYNITYIGNVFAEV